MATLPAISLETIVVASSDQVACDVGDETVVLNLKDGVYYGLNPVAASVWRTIQKEKTVAEIRDMLMQEYDVQPEACEEDLLGLLSQLMAWRLIVARNGKLDTTQVASESTPPGNEGSPSKP